jgi:uncharacterized delta-60 repeat protein
VLLNLLKINIMKNIICFLFVCNCFAQAGSFDTTFDTDGKATYCYTLGINNIGVDGGLQSSGKIIGYSNSNNTVNWRLIRWSSNGTLDTSFGINGFVNYTQSGPFINGGHYPYRMVIQSDDKIIIMGLQQNNTYPNAYWVARLLPDGSLDTSFNGTGYKDLSFGTPQDRGTCVALQTDGKILLGGTSGNTADYFTVARLNSNGSLDTGFGINGNAQIPFNGNESFVQSMAVQTDGKILLGGYSVNIPHGKDFALVRLNSNGSTDTGFGSSGKVVTTISNNSDRITDLVIEPDGKIIAGGFSSSESNPWMCMVRYLANGTIDTAFGVNGIVVNNDDNSKSCSIARQVDGRIVMGGCYDGTYFLLIRYNNNGTKDSSFGTNGVVNAFPTTYGYATKILIQSDNKIVATGVTTGSSFSQACAAVIRLDPGTLGVEEFANNKITIYPNPSSGIVHFETNNLIDEKFSVLLYNTLGQKVYEKKDLVEDGNINLSSLAKGIYFVTFSNDTKTITKTLLIK